MTVRASGLGSLEEDSSDLKHPWLHANSGLAADMIMVRAMCPSLRLLDNLCVKRFLYPELPNIKG